MKIVTFKISLAVADHQTREAVADEIGKICSNPAGGIYGAEILNPCPEPSTVLDAEPRKKRKYTRRAKPAEGDDKRTTTRGRGEPAGAVVKDGVVRVKRDDGTTIERRGNCQGGNAS